MSPCFGRGAGIGDPKGPWWLKVLIPHDRRYKELLGAARRRAVLVVKRMSKDYVARSRVKLFTSKECRDTGIERGVEAAQ